VEIAEALGGLAMLPYIAGFGSTSVGCWPAILIPLGCSSGTNLTFPQVAKSPILRSEPFSSRLATDRRSKNSYV
jgi:hypothetical protein